MRVTTTRMLEALLGPTRPSHDAPQAGRLNDRADRGFLAPRPCSGTPGADRGTHPRGRSDYSLAKEQRKLARSRTPDKYRMFGTRPATTPACNRLGQLALTRPVTPDHRPRRPGAGGESYRPSVGCQLDSWIHWNRKVQWTWPRSRRRETRGTSRIGTSAARAAGDQLFVLITSAGTISAAVQGTAARLAWSW